MPTWKRKLAGLHRTAPHSIAQLRTAPKGSFFLHFIFFFSSHSPTQILFKSLKNGRENKVEEVGRGGGAILITVRLGKGG